MKRTYNETIMDNDNTNNSNNSNNSNNIKKNCINKFTNSNIENRSFNGYKMLILSEDSAFTPTLQYIRHMSNTICNNEKVLVNKKKNSKITNVKTNDVNMTTNNVNMTTNDVNMTTNDVNITTTNNENKSDSKDDMQILINDIDKLIDNIEMKDE